MEKRQGIIEFTPEFAAAFIHTHLAGKCPELRFRDQQMQVVEHGWTWDENRQLLQVKVTSPALSIVVEDEVIPTLDPYLLEYCLPDEPVLAPA